MRLKEKYLASTDVLTTVENRILNVKSKKSKKQIIMQK